MGTCDPYKEMEYKISIKKEKKEKIKDLSQKNTLNIKKEDIINENRLNLQKNINLKGMLKFAAIAQNSICKIKMYGGYGSGFFCKIPYPNSQNLLKCLITNYHVVDKEYLESEDKIKFELNSQFLNISLEFKRKIWINEEMDYTIIEIIESDKINEFLTCDEKMNLDDFNIKEYREASILLPSFMKSGEIETDKGHISSIDNYHFLHTCNTDPGSSGGPIILLDNFAIIGIHKGYDKKRDQNVGIFLYNILNDMKEKKSIYKRLNNKFTKNCFLLLGKIGVGKSTLGKILSEDESIIIGNKFEKETKESNCYNCQNDDFKYAVIDTPGYEDTNNENIENFSYLENILSTKSYKIKGILLIFSFQEIRLGKSHRKILEYIVNLFPSENFWNYVTIIFTKTFWDSEEELDEIKDKRIKYFKEEFDTIINKFYNDKNIKKVNFENMEKIFVNLKIKKTKKTQLMNIISVLKKNAKLEPLNLTL